MMRWLAVLLTAASSFAVSAAPGDLKQCNIQRSQLIEDVTYVPSGVAEVSRLQFQEGYAYLKP